MTANPYQVLGAATPMMLGRKEMLRKVRSHLFKSTPDHLSLVGPKHFGKSVFLRRLCNDVRQASGDYICVVYLDFGVAAISSDVDFRKFFASGLRDALRLIDPEKAEYIQVDDEGVQELMGLLFDELASENRKILVVMDNFDYAFIKADLSRNLWDQIRTLAQKSSLRLITGSRRPLRELCKSEESRTSDFWEIFYDTPVTVGPFEENELDELLEPLLLAGRICDESAKKEIRNWTGRVPLLLMALLKELFQGSKQGQKLSKEDVDQVAERILAEKLDLLDSLWEDCDSDTRKDLVALSEESKISLAGFPQNRKRSLECRGLARIAGSNNLAENCRLMSRYAVSQGSQLSDLRALFESTESYRKNIRIVLELRLAQVRNGPHDADLAGYIANAIRDLLPQPKQSLMWFRSISERALELVWRQELGPDRKYPDAWVDMWRAKDARYFDRRRFPEAEYNLPRESGSQCNILRLATGNRDMPALTIHTHRKVFFLINHIHALGDFGQHIGEYPDTDISLEYVASGVLSAIELIDNLAKPGASL